MTKRQNVLLVFFLFLSELWNDYFLNIDKNAKIWLYVCILARD